MTLDSILMIGLIISVFIVFRHRDFRGPELKDGKNFTKKEKKILLKAIYYARNFYLDNNDKLLRGLCSLLSDCIKEASLGERFEDTYYNTNYLSLQGLKISSTSGYWWPLEDTDSRLKALDILEQAIIND